MVRTISINKPIGMGLLLKPFATSSNIYRANAFRVKNTSPDADYWQAKERDLGGRYILSEAREVVRAGIAPFLPESGNILDLMCGRHSYIDKKEGRNIHGIGLAPEMMERNKALHSFDALDVNASPYILPTKPGPYKTALISFGLPYLTHPLETLRSVRSLLGDNGKLIIVFSTTVHILERAVAIWNDPKSFGFEDQPALARDYLERSGFRILKSDKLPEPEHFSPFAPASFNAFLTVAEKYARSN